MTIGLLFINGHKRIAVRSEYRHVALCRSIGDGRWNPELKIWTWPLDPLIAEKIDKTFPSTYNRTPGFIELRQQVASEVIPTGDNLTPIPLTKNEPWEHQLRAYHFAKPLRGAMLDIAMGGGKSKITIDLIQNSTDKRVLIICPKKVVPVWPVQFERYCVVPYRILPLRDGTNQQRLAMAKQAMATTKLDTLLVIVINYDSARNDPFAAWALAQQWDRLVLDESHKIKAPGGATSRFCATLARRATSRLGLTGTPLPHSPLDAYGQFRAIDPTVFGTSFARFRSKYAIMGGYQQKQVLGYQNQDEFHRRFYSRAIRVEKDVLDLPPEMHMRPPDIPYATLGKKARDLYMQLEDDLIAELDGGEVVASNVLVQLLRLHEIAGGFLSGTKVDTGKEELLEELLDDIDPSEPVVVFALFRKELEVIHEVAKRLGRASLELSGSRDELARWPKDGPILVVQIQAGGVGIDLTAACYGIYYSKGFSLGDYDQSLARIHRPGQTRNTTYYHLVTERTVDQKIERALTERRELVKAILTWGLRD